MVRGVSDIGERQETTRFVNSTEAIYLDVCSGPASNLDGLGLAPRATRTRTVQY
jgi:hypothetical protein